MKPHLRLLFLRVVFLMALSSFFLWGGLLKGQDETASVPGASTQAEEVAKKEDASSQAQELITVNFENIDISEVLRVLSEKSRTNIVSGPDVKAVVNLQLVDVPWEKAMDVILRTYNLTYKKEPGLIRVMTLEQLKLEEEKVPLATKIIKMNFTKVEDVKTSFNSMLSPRGKIEVDSRTNSLIVTDLPENIVKIESVATQLDSRTPQVMIEAMLADVKLVNDESLGIQWNWARNKDWISGRSAKTLVGSTSTLLPTTYAGSIVFGQTILKYTDLTAEIRIWQQQKRVNILAHPIIMTLDNQPAHIELIEQIPYTQQTQSTQSGSGLSSTAFKDAGIKLDVTPHITTKDNYISMNLKVEQSFRSGFTPDNQPIIDSRKAETNLLVKDGETIVIGGLRKKEDTITIDKVPFLGDIPILGMAFRKKSKSVTDIDLLIFVTPKVIVESVLDETDLKRLKLFTPTPEEEKKFEMFDKKEKPQAKPAEIRQDLKKEEVFTLRPPS